MASAEEMRVLVLPNRDSGRSGQQAHAVSLAGQIVTHLVNRLLRVYRDSNDTKSPGRLAKSVVLVNTLDRHLKSSKLNVSSSAFAEWRANPSAPIQGSIKVLLGSRRSGP